ncbi:hypothetical protein T07_10307 [Trichinella nelsoni]|uniref:Uncharacterized protein n=1 Tax=Trichinella nelsoni TaxID=6336 RepID=A0A0V0SIA1_9BILA|nr:hypothetical protein T07_10307 [Trichinella nelsoni]
MLYNAKGFYPLKSVEAICRTIYFKAFWLFVYQKPNKVEQHSIPSSIDMDQWSKPGELIFASIFQLVVRNRFPIG